MVAEAGGRTARSAPSQALWPLRSFVLMVEGTCPMEQVLTYLVNTTLDNLNFLDISPNFLRVFTLREHSQLGGRHIANGL